MNHAPAYAQAGIDLCYCGAEFTRAAQLLDEKQYEEAATAIRNGLDRLTVVVSETLPRHAAEMEAV